MPRAFITGITGQDGQHLAQFLYDKGYDVYGMVKGQSNPRVAAVLEEMPFIEMIPGDLADLPSLVSALAVSQLADGRYRLRLMQTTLVLRPDVEDDYISTPYDELAGDAAPALS